MCRVEEAGRRWLGAASLLVLLMLLLPRLRGRKSDRDRDRDRDRAVGDQRDGMDGSHFHYFEG